MNADVNCDTITLTVDGVVYKLDYGFGRLGVRDLGGWDNIIASLWEHSHVTLTIFTLVLCRGAG